MDSMVIIANNTVLYTWMLLREKVLKILTTHTKEMVIMWQEGGVS